MTAAKNDLMKKEIFRLHLIDRVVSVTQTTDPGRMKLEEGEGAERVAHRRAVFASHEEIYQAIARRDISGAKLAMERHIQDIIDRNLRNLTYTERIAKELVEEELTYTA